MCDGSFDLRTRKIFLHQKTWYLIFLGPESPEAIPMGKHRFKADPRGPGRPKKGEQSDPGEFITVKIRKKFRTEFTEAARTLGRGLRYEYKRALEDRMDFLEYRAEQIKKGLWSFQDDDDNIKDANLEDEDPEEKAG